MKRIRYTFLLVGVIFATSVMAQKITPNQLKQIRSAVYNWVDKYLEYSYLSSKYDIKEYRSLFANDQVSVVNDYLPITEDERIAIVEYNKLYLDPSQVYNAYPYTNDSSISIQSEQINAKSYECVLEIHKSITFMDEEKQFEYPRKDYTLYITLEYNFKTKKILCTDIYSSDQLSVDYILHQSSDTLSHKYIESKDTIEVLKNNEQLPVITSKYLYHYPFDNKMVEVRRDTMKHTFHLGAIVGPSFYSSSFNTEDFYNHSQKAGLVAGIDLGFYHQCHLKKNHRVGVEYGLMFSRNTVHILGNYKTQYHAIDPDEGEYMRLVNATDFHEQIQLLSLSIPLFIRYDYFLRPHLSIFGRIGAYASYDLYQQSNISVNAHYAGFYDWLFDLTIDQNGIYDFGNFHQEGTVQDLFINKLNVGILFDVGCQYFIPKSRWSIEPSIR